MKNLAGTGDTAQAIDELRDAGIPVVEVDTYGESELKVFGACFGVFVWAFKAVAG